MDIIIWCKIFIYIKNIHDKFIKFRTSTTLTQFHDALVQNFYANTTETRV